MVSAKEIIIKPITSKAAIRLVKKVHYSHSVAMNSQFHLGVFLNGSLEGAMQFGPSLDKSKTIGLVKDTHWNGFMELNRMAFSDVLPRNSESRAISIAMRMIKKHYPHIEWIVSYADGTQCGDGTIYRASGFVLTGIKKNNTIWQSPEGECTTHLSLQLALQGKGTKKINRVTITTGASSMKPFKDAGYKPMVGYQLRYIYFINKAAQERLNVEVLPFSKIDEMNARMYKGIAAKACDGNDQLHSEGATPI